MTLDLGESVVIPKTSEPERQGSQGHPVRMIVTLHTAHLTRIEQIECPLNGTAEINFQAPDPAPRLDRHRDPSSGSSPPSSA